MVAELYFLERQSVVCIQDAMQVPQVCGGWGSTQRTRYRNNKEGAYAWSLMQPCKTNRDEMLLFSNRYCE